MRGLIWLYCIAGLCGCFVAQNIDTQTEDTRCVTCHGSVQNPGTIANRSAPPFDLRGQSETSSPGVGAHQIHLQSGETHGAIACTECHRVPTRTSTEGHGDNGKTDFAFGPIAKSNDRSPAYDGATRTCSNSHCHGTSSSGIWTSPRTSTEACGSCHGLPPPSPHPQSDRCEVCHAEVIDEQRLFVDPSRHVDGKVQFAPPSCTACHGQGVSAAPPFSVDGGTNRSQRGVGAHGQHLTGGNQSRAVECTECHVVPTSVRDGHPRGTGAQLQFSGVATARGAKAEWDANALTCQNGCHTVGSTSAASPAWTTTDALGCTGCHGMPPAAPHPQVAKCSNCHATASGDLGQTISDGALHVNGIVELKDGSCVTCHGSKNNAAPPTDTHGNTSSSLPGVGAHQIHVKGTSRSRAVGCHECHTVPDALRAPQHLNGVADVVFSGVATQFGMQPTYKQQTCSNSYCHDTSHFLGPDSGVRVPSPVWTQVDGTQAFCGACHGLPPPLPHPFRYDCGTCHRTANTNGDIIAPSLHVNGELDF